MTPELETEPKTSSVAKITTTTKPVKTTVKSEPETKPQTTTTSVVVTTSTIKPIVTTTVKVMTSPVLETTLPQQPTCDPRISDSMVIVDVAGISDRNLDQLKVALVEIVRRTKLAGDGNKVCLCQLLYSFYV